MADTAETTGKRAPRKGQFQLGNNANPGGRPKRLADLAAKIAEMDDAHRQRLEEIAAQGKHVDSVAAIKLLWAYAHGHPAQHVTADGDGSLRIGVVVLPAETGE